MVNEKLILETVGNLTEKIADLHFAIAGMAELLASRLSNLSQDEKDTLRKNVNGLLKESELQKAVAMRLQEKLKSL